MSNYTVAIKNSAKVDLRKIKQSNLKKQFEEGIWEKEEVDKWVEKETSR